MKSSNINNKIYFLKSAYQKMRYYVSLCEDEISGLGKIEEQNGKLVVTDVQIFKQVVSGAHSDLDDDALAEFLFEKTKNGDDLAKWRLWWHSHAKMNVFFSGTDTNTIDTSTEFPWLISVVTNHKNEILARYDTYKPYRLTENLLVEILEDENLALKEECKKEIEEKVSQSRSYGYPGYQYYNQNKKKDNKEFKKERRTLFWEDEIKDQEARERLGK